MICSSHKKHVLYIVLATGRMRKALERPAEKTAKQVGSESDGNVSSNYLKQDAKLKHELS